MLFNILTSCSSRPSLKIWVREGWWREIPPFSSSVGERKIMNHSFENLVGVEDYCHEIYVSYINITILVVPAWTAGTQVDMDVSERILRGWMPAIHAGMTEAADGQNAVKYWR